MEKNVRLNQVINFFKERELNSFHLEKSRSICYSKPIKLKEVEDHLEKTLNHDQFEDILIDYGGVTLNYLIEELDFSYSNLIDFEYQSIGPVFFEQSIGILSYDPKFHYLLRNTEDESEIFIKQHSSDLTIEIQKIIKLYFEEVEYFNLEKSMGSVPSVINIPKKYRELLSPKIIKECISLFLDSFPIDIKIEKWILELEDLDLRFEFDNHYERSMKILRSLTEKFQKNQPEVSQQLIDESSFKNKLLTLIIYHKLKYT